MFCREKVVLGRLGQAVRALELLAHALRHLLDHRVDHALGDGVAIVRAMPNTPSSAG
mgnify:CR=1 FL=1